MTDIKSIDEKGDVLVYANELEGRVVISKNHLQAVQVAFLPDPCLQTI